MTPFEIGQRIVCTDDAFRPSRYGEMMPRARMIYTVRGRRLHPHGSVGLHLEETVNTPQVYRYGIEECCFRASRFRPLA